MRVTAVVMLLFTAIASASRPLYYTCTKPGLIALTTDDGPSGNATEMALLALVENNVVGTFFFNGRQVRPGYSLRDENIRAMRKVATTPGMTIGHHTYNHVNAITGSWPSYETYFEEQLEAETRLFETLVGFDVTKDFLRPPYLAFNLTMFQYLQREHGFKTVSQSINPRDWDMSRSMQDVISSLVDPINAADPKYDSFISLHHPKIRGAEESYHIFNAYIKAAKAKGFRFVSIEECLQ